MDKTRLRARIDETFDALGLDESSRRSLLRVLALAVATRLLLCGAVYLAVTLGGARAHPLTRTYGITHPVLTGLLRWDVPWYVSVLEQGYWFDSEEASNVAFLPGFPAASAVVDLFVQNHFLAPLVAANLAFVPAVLVLWLWVNERVGVREAEAAAILVIVYPFSFFLNTGYSESLFFLLCTLALRDADRRSWTSAGVFAALATMTRPFGILLVPAFALGIATREGVGALLKRAPAILLPVAALGLYALYLWLEFGTPFAVLRAQEIGWSVGRGWNLPLWRHTTHAVQAVSYLVQVVLPVPLALLAYAAWRKLGPVSGLYAVLVTITVMVSAGDSIGREALSVVPAFAAAGTVRLGLPAVSGLGFAGLALLVTLTCGFAVGQFMG